MLYMNDFPDDGRAHAETCEKGYFKIIKKGLIQSPSVQ